MRELNSQQVSKQMALSERLPVKLGLHTFDKPMTRTAAKRLGERLMPNDLKRAGFECVVGRSDIQMHGGEWFRINYGKKVGHGS